MISCTGTEGMPSAPAPFIFTVFLEELYTMSILEFVKALNWGIVLLFTLLYLYQGLYLIIGLIFAMLVVLFVSIPLQVGICRYMMENRQGATPFGTVFSAFSVQYLHTVGVLFTTNLLIVWPYLVTIALALLSAFTTPLLLILMVPCLIFSLVYAINRGYSWYLVPWLLAENPYLTADRARQLSRDMTMGDKWNIFVLELSFIGWDILASLLFGLGHFFLNPYKQATFAELYAAMRAKAMAAGYSNEQELAGFVRHPMM